MSEELPDPEQTLFGPPVSDMTLPGGAAALDKTPSQISLNAPTRPGIAGRLDGFEVIKQLGAGGMGVVLLVRNSAMDAFVAIKLLRPEMSHDSRIVHRFLIEARHMYRMSHPHILKVLDVRERPEGPYYVMPYLKRGPLSGIMRPGEPLDPTLTLSICRQVADALAYAHNQGVIHRDLKPANVLLDEQNRAYLSDFGLVRTVFNDSIVDIGASQCEGTAAYMSPAVAAGQAEDTRCDIYSFGAMLYELLTGEPPYTGRNSNIVLQQILAGPPTPILKRVPMAPTRLASIAEHAMARELRDRYASMADVAADLERVGRGEAPIGPHGRAPGKKADTGAGRTWRRAAAVLMAIAAMAAIAVWSAHRPSKATEESGAPRADGIVAPERGKPIIPSNPTPAAVNPIVASGAGVPPAFGPQSDAWRARKPGFVRTLHGHAKPCFRLNFLSDDRLLSCAGSGDYSIRLWDVVAGTEARQMNSNGRWADASAAGRWVFSDRRVHDMERNTANDIAGGPYDWNWAKVAPDGGQVVFAVPNAGTSQDVWVFRCPAPDGSQKLIASSSDLKGHFFTSEFSANGAFFLLSRNDNLDVYETGRWTVAATRSHPGSDVWRRYDLISPDGQVVLIADDNNAVLWNWKTGHEVKLPFDKSRPKLYRFSPDGRGILTRDGAVPKIWSVQDGSLIASFSENGDTKPGSVQATAFSPNGKWLLTGHDDGTLGVWDIAAARRITTFVSPIDFNGEVDGFSQIVVSPDGLLAAAAATRSGDLAVWRLPDDAVDKSTLLAPEIAVPAAPKLPAQVGQIAVFNGHNSPVGVVRFMKDGLHLFSGGEDAQIMWDWKANKESWRIVDSGVEAPKVAFQLGMIESFSANNQMLLCGGKLYDVESGKIIHDYALPRRPEFARLSPDGTLAAFSRLEGFLASVWTTGDFQRQFTFDHGDGSSGAVCFVFSPNSRQVALSNFGKSFSVNSADTGTSIFTKWMDGRSRSTFPVAFSSDGRLVLVIHDDDSVRLWDMEGRVEAGRFDRQTLDNAFRSYGPGTPYSLAMFSPDCTRVLIADQASLRQWDVKSQKELPPMKDADNTALATAAVYSPDGSRVLAGYLDGSMRLWDSMTASRIDRYDGHLKKGRVLALAFSSDGNLAASAASADNAVRLWHLPPQPQSTAQAPSPTSAEPAPATLTDAERAAGWKLLFDGKTTAGWRGYNSHDFPSGWIVADGTLSASGKGGDLVTSEIFDNFELQLDCKVGSGANSGVMFHGVEDGRAPWQTTPQFQLIDDAGNANGIDPKTQSGSCFNVYPATRIATKPLGEWNHLRLLVNNNHVEHWLNDEKVCEYVIGNDDWKSRTAHCIEGFASASAGPIDLENSYGEVAFRNIKIRKISEPLPNTLTDDERAAGWKLLFDGKTFAGWRGYKRSDVPAHWRVADGVLTADGSRGGDLVTADKYRDFELRLDWKIAAGGNSGVMYHVTEDHNQPFDSGPEFQLLDNAGNNIAPNSVRAAGSCYNLYAPAKDATKPVGQWNQLRLIVHLNHVEHWLNGEKVCEYVFGNDEWNARIANKFPDLAKAAEGLIDLQSYDNEVAFRNIKILPLNPNAK